MNESEGVSAAEADVEDWVAMTQNTLGCLISKPRMLPDRLRKPPFRFLFDIAVEVARQSGFGVQELFGGELAEKPAPPGSRDEKVSFLERWVAMVAAALGEQAPDLAYVSAQHIVCGALPEWTNFLLQCTAAAVWPDCVEAPWSPAALEAAPARAGEAAANAAAAEGAVQGAEEGDAEVPPGAAEAPPPDAAEAAEAVPEAAPTDAGPGPPAAEAEVAHDATPPVTVQAPESAIDEEKARELAANLDFSQCLEQYEHAHQELMRTSGAWKPLADRAASPSAEGEAAEQAPELGPDGRPMTAAQGELKKAKETTTKINDEIAKAQELLQQMEMGIDHEEEELQRRRLNAAQQRAELEAHKAREAAEAEAQARAKLEAAQREAEELDAEAAAIAAADAAEAERLRAKKEAAKARRAAEKAAAEAEANKPSFPMSKTSQMQGARMVAALPDDEYQDDFEEADGEEEAEPPPPAPSNEDPHPSGGYVDIMSGCFTDAILGPDTRPPEPSKAGFAMDGMSGFAAAQSSLFERLKGELKETFISFLTASMPETLLRKYQPDELISCLQLLLKELRACCRQHGLGDVDEEEPTSIAEDLRQAAPGGAWLDGLQAAAPWSLRSKHDVPELVDTLQSLATVCSERLGDEVGPLSRWCDEESPLRKIPDLPPPSPPLDDKEDLDDTWRPDSAPQEAGGRWHSDLGEAPEWEKDLKATPAAPPPPTAGGRPVTGAGFDASRSGFHPAATAGGGFAGRATTAQGRTSPLPGQTSPERARQGSPSRQGAAPVFSSSLGPALWEQEALGVPSTAGPATALRGATASRGFTATTTGPRPPMMSSTGVGFSSTRGGGQAVYR